MIQVSELFEKNWGIWNAPIGVRATFVFVDCGTEVVESRRNLRGCVVRFCSRFELSEKSAVALIQWIDAELIQAFLVDGVTTGRFSGVCGFEEVGRVDVDLRISGE